MCDNPIRVCKLTNDSYPQDYWKLEEYSIWSEIPLCINMHYGEYMLCPFCVLILKIIGYTLDKIEKKNA